MNNINLVTTRTTDTKIEKNLRLARIIAGILLGLVIIFSVILFLLKNYYSSESILQQQSMVSRQLLALQQKAIKLDFVQKRIVTIRSILTSAPATDAQLRLFLDILPPDVKADTLNSGQNALTLIVSSSSLNSINTYIDRLILMSKQQKMVKTILLDSLAFSPGSGRYILSLKVTFL